MLLDGNNSPQSKQVTVLTRNPVATRLFGGILREWGIEMAADPASAQMVFVERGIGAPVSRGRLVWLSSMPVRDGEYLDIPLSLTRLYHLLEQELFSSPRRHIRVPLQGAVELHTAHGLQSAELTSMSDRGCRLDCDRELAKGQPLVLDMILDRQRLRINGEVIYTIPAGDLSRTRKPKVGVLFSQIDQTLCNALRMFIEKTCVARACSHLGVATNNPAITWIDLARNPWAELQ
ncbi:MAG: PilZ domain-containing protein [Deltaproteobacteria bacterium]|jgi:Tfp pilus assembly protein PilZ|nr:PilZ domain-containing protein [Deltaproteobacteria bacterium]